MAVKVDLDLARRILEEETLRAQLTPSPIWEERIERLSNVCAEARCITHPAVLGTALIAKAANLDIDPFALKEDADLPGAYSARGIADRVLAPWAAETRVNIGPTGANPINNSPFYRPLQVSPKFRVRNKARAALDALCEALTHASRIRTETDARDALRAFIRVRMARTVAAPLYTAPSGAGAPPLRMLAEAVACFVREDSEGGKRAQAVVAGLLDVMVGPDRVVSKRINDPSRGFPGDVGILGAGASAEQQNLFLSPAADHSKCDPVFEVRDKAVSPADVRMFVDRVARAGIERAAVVSVAAAQPERGILVMTRSLIDDAARKGVILMLFLGWGNFVRQIAFWSQASPATISALAHERIYARLCEIEASPQSLESWMKNPR